MDLLAFDVIHYWWHFVWPLMLFILGLSLVIFVHELGHFLVAKWVGIKVERFALGFGKRVLGFHWGETDYCICALPLGGYVKMLGQEDFKALKEGDAPDPRSFEQKSVGARFAVISAGVVMNVILAAVLFMIVGLVGKKYQSPYIGGALPGTPAGLAQVRFVDHGVRVGKDAAPASQGASSQSATPQMSALNGESPWQGGFRPGDRIVEIRGDSWVLALNDYKASSFADLSLAAALASPDETFDITIEREAGGLKRTGVATVGVVKSGGLFKFGFDEPADAEVALSDDIEWDLSPLKPGDRILAVAGQRIEHAWDIAPIDRTLTGKPVQVTVLRDGKRKDVTLTPKLRPAENVLFRRDGSVIDGMYLGSEKDKIKVRVKQGSGEVVKEIKADEVNIGDMTVLGMKPYIRVAAVMTDSAAQKGGMKQGDVIIDYAEKGTPDYRQLMKISADRVGEKTSMVVLRDGRSVPLWVVPKKKGDVSSLGIIPDSLTQESSVGSVDPNSPAGRAKIRSGAVIKSVNGQAVASWTDLYHALKANMGKELTVAYLDGKTPRKATLPMLTAAMFKPDAYSFSSFGLMETYAFKPLWITIKQDGPAAALKWGGTETLRWIIVSYASIRSLILQNASLDQASGPVGMGAIGLKVVRQGFIEFVYFIAFISAAIAIFNFLPLPVVDGGHAVFLIIEKIRGRPVPVKIMNVVQTVGLVLLIGLFLYITWNDIIKIKDGIW